MSAPVEYLIDRLRDAATDAAAEEYGVAGLLAEAAAALEAAREDAERYRWLRVNEPDREDTFLSYCFEELDAAIDQLAREGGRE